MKAALLLLLVLLCAAFAADLGKLQKAHKCCELGCSDEEFRSLQHEISSMRDDVLGTDEAHALEFAKKVVNGEAHCRATKADEVNVKRQATRATSLNNITVSCPLGPYNASSKPVSVICSFTAVLPAGNTFYYIYAYLFGPSSQTVYSYIYPGSGLTSYSGIFNFTLPRYAASGNWTTIAGAYNSDYSIYLYSLSRTGAIVSAGVNDNMPPSVNQVTVPAWTVNPCGLSNYLSINVSDDLSGVSRISVYANDVNYTYAVSFSQTFSPPVLSKIIFVNWNSYVPLSPGNTYRIQVSLYDGALNYGYLTTPAAITVSTSSCLAGKYLSGGSCVSCPASKFSNNGSFSCCACPAGTISAGPGAAACTPCPTGYTSLGGATQCTLCPAGTFGYTAKTPVCLACSSGTTSAPGSTTCSSCPPGTSSCGGAACTPCAKGTYSSYGARCEKCLPGYFTSATGQSECAPCPINTYAASVGAATCIACPNGKTSFMGSNSALNCV